MARQLLISTLNPGKGNFHYYNLPKGMLNLSLKQITFPLEGSGIEAEYELYHEVKMLPDPDHRYYLQYFTRGTSNDKLKVAFSEEGYLKSIESVSEDTTLKIVENIIDSVKQAVVPGAPGGVMERGGTQPVELFQATIDPFDANAIAEVEKEIRSVDKNFKLGFRSMASKAAIQQSAPAGEDRPGIYCKPMELCEFHYSLQGTAKQFLMSMPHPQVTHLVSVPHAPFVSSSLKITFGPYGYPTEIDLDQPSWVEALSAFPAKFLKGLVEIPAQLIRLRVNYNNEKASATEELEASRKRIADLEKRIGEGGAESPGAEGVR